MSLFLWVVVACLGLIVGSFLNVVIVRLPVMLARQWRQDAVQYLGLSETEDRGSDASVNLCVPRSFCPHCHHAIPAYDNIPLFSFAWLRGRCRFCRQPISWQYPLVELLSLYATLVSFGALGWGWSALWVSMFAWFLIVGAGIDWHTQFLPDEVTWPLLAWGLLGAFWGILLTPSGAICGLLLGYYLLWGLYWVFWFLTRQEGMGFGDFKWVAAIGTIVGPYGVFVTLFLAACFGLCAVFIRMLYDKIRRHAVTSWRGQKIAFGPYLALGGWCAFWWVHAHPVWLP